MFNKIKQFDGICGFYQLMIDELVRYGMNCEKAVMGLLDKLFEQGFYKVSTKTDRFQPHCYS